MRLLHRYAVVRLGPNPSYDTTLAWTLTRRGARRERALRRFAGDRDLVVLDAFTGRYV